MLKRTKIAFIVLKSCLQRAGHVLEHIKSFKLDISRLVIKLHFSFTRPVRTLHMSQTLWETLEVWGWVRLCLSLRHLQWGEGYQINELWLFVLLVKWKGDGSDSISGHHEEAFMNRLSIYLWL